jgi:uncharacterized protein YkwD
MLHARTFVIAVMTTGLLVAAGPASTASAAAACVGATAATAGVRAVSPARDAVLCLVNAERRERGLPPLRSNDDLELAAQRHSADMVDRGYFEHDSPGGTTVRDRVQRTGYLKGVRRWSLGENIGWASRSISSPAGMVKAWMESPGHREIILTRTFREAGVGIAMGVPSGRRSGATFTMDFGLATR